MNRTQLAFTVRLAMLTFAFAFVLAGLPKPAVAQSDITDDETVDVTDEFCDPDEGDDCEVESIASILDSSTTTDIDTYAATFITDDLLDYGYEAYVEGYLYQDGTLIADGYAYDEGDGVAELDGATTINLADGPYAYEMYADSYLYDGEDYYGILETEADATLGAPVVTSVSPAYVFVGTSGSLTINGQALINPFGGGTTSVSAVPATPGATGLTISGDSFSDTQGSASYTASLTATAGPWDIGLGTEFGGTIYATTTKGLFTVGDPTPSITSVSPSAWVAGTTTTVTITGSGFGSNPTLTITAAGVTSSITSHSDTGGTGGAKITASVTVSLCTPAETASVVVTSTGYTGTGFVAAYSGQSSSGSSSATVTPITAPAPTISYLGKVVTTASVVVGQEILLTGTVPTTQKSCLASQSWSLPTGTAIGSWVATANPPVGKTTPVPTTTTAATYGPFYWVTSGTPSMTFGYKLTNGVSSANATTKFTVTAPTAVKLYTCGGSGIGAAGCTATGALGKVAINPGPVLQFGGTATNIGIEFTASATAPAGAFLYNQLITNDVTTETPSNGGTVQICYPPELPTAGVFPGLDTQYPYPYVGTPPVTNDNPGTGTLTNVDKTVSRAFSAQMFLMWTPTAATGCTGAACTVPVPLGSVKWSLTAAASLTNAANNTWAVTSGSGTASAFVASSSYPTWTSWVEYHGALVCHNQ